MMSVTVYRGDNFVLTNEHVLGQAAAQPLLQPVLVLVPDRFTLQAERFLLKQKPQLLNTRVITFSMLYRLVADELNFNREPVTVLDKTSAVLHLWTAIREVQGQLTWFKKSAGYYDFAEKMYNTLNQMRSSCVDFTTLENQAPSVVAKKKHHDINLIYQAYCQNIAPCTDSSGMLEYLSSHLAESTLVQNAMVYVCGFSSLSPARLAVLSGLCHTARQVTIAASENEFAAQLNYSCYQITAKPFVPQIATVRQETERGEATVIIEKIVQLIADGTAPEEIVVLLTEFDKVAPIWQVVADKYHLPVNLDIGTKLSTTAEAKYLRDLLELMLNDDTENTVAVLFNQCNDLPDDTINDLDNQIVARGLRARKVPELKKLTAVKTVPELCQQLMQLTTHEKLQTILMQIAKDCAEQPLVLREFITLFWTLCSATKVSNIPQYIDRVLIAPVNDWVPTRVKYLFIANCTADNFPQGQSDDDILQEADLVGTQITPTPSLQRARNYRHAELLQTVATTQVTLSGTCDDFKMVAYQPLTNFQWQDTVFFQTPITVGRELFFVRDKVKTTAIEKYYDCPRFNFWQNGLKLQPRPLHTLQVNHVGSAFHEALRDYFTHYNLEQAVQVGIQTLAYDYTPLTNNIAKEIRFVLQQLVKLFQKGGFNGKPLVETPVQRKLQSGLTLVGRVDRVDVADLENNEHAFMVLDYKTGRTESVPRSIYLGNKLQLPVYSSILAKQLGRIVGAGYLPLSSGYAQDEKQFLLKGFFDQELKELIPPALLSPSSKNCLDGNLILKICQYANDMVDQAVAKILAGNVAPQAVNQDACQYCPVKLFCPQAEINCRAEQLKGKTVTFKIFGEVQDE